MQNAKIYNNCPPLSYPTMTSWKSSSDYHYGAIRREGFKDAHAWKQFLTDNAASIIVRDRKDAEEKSTCTACTPFQPDPFGHNAHWENVQKNLGLRA